VFHCVVPIVAVAAWQEELRIDEMGIFCSELQRVLAHDPRETVLHLIRILLLILVIGRTDSGSAEFQNRDVGWTTCAGVNSRQGIVRILQAKVIHHLVVDRPSIVYRYFATVYRLILIEL